MITSIETVVFQRQKYGAKEEGILLNEGDAKIIDSEGKSVENVWNYSRIPGLAIFGLNIGAQYIQYSGRGERKL